MRKLVRIVVLLWVNFLIGSSARTASAQQAATQRVFDAGNSPSPWPYSDWASGYYKAECTSGGPMKGLSAYINASGPIAAGTAHSILCESPAPGGAWTGGPFPFIQDNPSVYSVETFSTSNSQHYGARFTDDWDPNYLKGECPADQFVTGVGQIANTKVVDKIKCSVGFGWRGVGPRSACTVRQFPGSAPTSPPEGDWAGSQYYKLSCDANQLLVGISANQGTHLPHAIMCCPMATWDSISLHSVAEVNNRRTALIQKVWQVSTINTSDGVNSVTRITQNPLSSTSAPPAGITVDRLGMTMPTAGGSPTGDGKKYVQGLADYLYHTPKSNKLIVMNPGHNFGFNDSEHSAQLVLEALAEGYDVMGTYMPRRTVEDFDGSNGAHGALFQGNMVPGNGTSPSGVHPMAYFLDPVRRSLNYALAQNPYSEVYMAGHSGGGWTATVYAALDTRVQISISNAGTQPKTFQPPISQGWPVTSLTDDEQFDDPPGGNDFYNFSGVRTGFLDLYVMGASGHRQIQVLNRFDGCCGGQPQFNYAGPAPAPASWNQAVRTYETQVAQQVAAFGGTGQFHVEINEAEPNVHLIAKNTRIGVVLAELDGSLRTLDTSTSRPFARGADGVLWQWTTTPGWNSLGVQATGTPAAIQSAVHQWDLFYRDWTNHLAHAYYNGTSWVAANDLPSFVSISDPAVVSWGSGRIDLVAVGVNYGVYHTAYVNGSWTAFDQVPTSPYLAVGPVAVTSFASGSLDIVFRTHDGGSSYPSNGGLAHIGYNGSSYSGLDNAGGAVIKSFPSTFAFGSSTVVAHVHGLDDRLWQGIRDGGWFWQNMSAGVPGAANIAIQGSPSVITFADGSVKSYMRINSSPFGPIGFFYLPQPGGWQFSSWTSKTTYGSPTAAASGVYVLDTIQSAWTTSNGTTWTSLAGVLER